MGQKGITGRYMYVSHNGSHCSSKITRESIEIWAIESSQDRGKTLVAEFCPDESLVGEGDGLEDGVAVGEVREVDIPDGVIVDRGGVEVECGVSRLEGIGMEEVSDGTGESKEPVMSLMLSEMQSEVRGLEEDRNADPREEGRVLMVWVVVHGVDGGEVYVAGGSR